MDSFLNTIFENLVKPKVYKPKEEMLMLINYDKLYSKPRKNLFLKKKFKIVLFFVRTSIAINDNK